MKTLIKKEIRLLLPAWMGAMLLAVAPAWLMEHFIPHRNAVVDVPPPLFILPGLLLLAVSSFGQEFSSKTFSLLLSQPFRRNRAWRLKISMLALAFVLVLAAETISWGLFIQLHPAYSSHYLDSLPSLWLWTIALFTGGLWTTLLLRQEVGAFWITFLVPAFILAGVGILGDCLHFSEQLDGRVGDLAVLIYSAAGFLFARRMFLHAQDTQWTGGNFLFWRRKSKEQASSFVFGPFRNRYIALLWKEIQLHEANLFIAAIVFVLNLIIICVLPYISNPNLKGALEFVWALWLLMPLLIGCAAVADERRLGVAESQLCQPVSRQAGFSIKFFVALFLSVVLGAVMPTLIERSRDFDITNWAAFWTFIAAPTIFFISFYASTLSRSTIHAIGVTIAVSVIGCYGFVAFVMAVFRISIGVSGISADYYDNTLQFGRYYLMVALCLLAFPLVVARLMYWNYKWLHQGWRIIRFNAAAILISFLAIFTLTNAVFFRWWEVFSSIEMSRGPVRLTAETPVKLSLSDDGLTALLPDGRLWRQGIDIRWIDFRSMYYERWEPLPNTRRFVGSNWADASQGGLYFLGVQRDGTLWHIPKTGSKSSMSQVGSDTDWLKVAANGNGYLLLKRNGTLWIWGTNQMDDVNDEFARIAKKTKLDLATPPHRIDPGTDWTDVAPFAFDRALVKKADGSLWSCRRLTFSDGTSSFRLVEEKNLDNQWMSYAYNYGFSAEVKTNGQLWLFYQIDKTWNDGTSNGNYWDWMGIPHYTKKIRLGSDSDWKAVMSGIGSFILLRNNGTLWKWDGSPLKPFHPFQLGKQSDWMSLSPGLGIALAADGSLWSWDDLSGHVWLGPSRKPVYMGNIFEGAGGDTHRTTPIWTHENAN